MVLKATPKFGLIDHNLHHHIFYDIMCKPPILFLSACQIHEKLWSELSVKGVPLATSA